GPRPPPPRPRPRPARAPRRPAPGRRPPPCRAPPPPAPRRPRPAAHARGGHQPDPRARPGARPPAHGPAAAPAPARRSGPSPAGGEHARHESDAGTDGLNYGPGGERHVSAEEVKDQIGFDGAEGAGHEVEEEREEEPARLAPIDRGEPAIDTASRVALAERAD